MRPTTCFGVLLAALLPLHALAQENPGLGMDFSDEAKKAEPAREAGTERETATGQPRPDLDRAAPAAEPRLSEVDVAAEDRVKSVQRKAFLKSGRFELTPLAFVTLNDAFYPKYGPGARASFYLKESLAIGVTALQYNLIPSENVRLAKRQLASRLPSVRPDSSVSLDLRWAPVYGKVAVFNAIRQFELYLVGGAGAVFSQTSNVDGAHLSTHLGIGQHFGLTDWMTLDLALIETMYADRPGGGNKSVTQHVLSVQGGLGFFLPFGFDYREP